MRHFPLVALSLVVSSSLFAQPRVVINEIDYDQPSTDYAEFIELYNGGSSAADLSTYSVVLVNGTGGGASVYQTIVLPSLSLAPGAFFVICGDAANTPGCDLDVSPDSNLIQNGAPDAVALYDGATLVDTVSYEGDTGTPYTEGSGSGLEDDSSIAFLGISRYPDGTDTDQNNADLSQRCITPGMANAAASSGCSAPGQPRVVVNEIDYDQSSTDSGGVHRALQRGLGAADSSTYSVELVNGTGGGASIYQTIVLPSVSLAAGAFFVICGNAANTINCDLDASPDTDLVQNGGPDAVALRDGTTLLDTVSYEGDTGAPYTEGTGVGLEDDPSFDYRGISRYPDGTDTDANATDFSPRCITPGFANAASASGCTAPGSERLVINELDYDQPGTDTAEFIEIYNAGLGAADLSTYSIQLINGTGGGAVVYQTIALPSVTLAAGSFFVVCANAATTPNCDLDVSPDSNLIQNGSPDGLGLYNGTTLVDAVSYEGDTGAPYTGRLGQRTGRHQRDRQPGNLALSQRRRHRPEQRGLEPALHHAGARQRGGEQLLRGACGAGDAGDLRHPRDGAGVALRQSAGDHQRQRGHRPGFQRVLHPDSGWRRRRRRRDLQRDLRLHRERPDRGGRRPGGRDRRRGRVLRFHGVLRFADRRPWTPPAIRCRPSRRSTSPTRRRRSPSRPTPSNATKECWCR